MSDDRSDRDLVADVNQGDVGAYEVLYRRHRDWVVRLACRFTGNDADALDVLQDTFTYLLGKFPGFTLSARMTTFLYPVVKNLSLAVVRRRRRAPVGEEGLDDVPSEEDGPTDRSAGRDELGLVLSSLPDGQREVLLMRVVDDLSLQEIADALDIPLGTVKSRLHNALQALRHDGRTRSYFLD